MADSIPGGTLTLADDLTISRMGYGAMQLAGPGVFGPPKDRDEALAVLREAADLGITHIDTADFYGPTVVNELIREALHPYPAGLRIVTKVGARRTGDGGWRPSLGPGDLRAQVRENLRHLGVDTLDVVNLRLSVEGTGEESLAEEFGALAQMQKEGLIRHLGLSAVSAAQLTEAQAIAPVVTVQNLYNLASRQDDALVDLVRGREHRVRLVLPPRRLHATAVRDAHERGRPPRRVAAAGRAGLAAPALGHERRHPRDVIGGPPPRERRSGEPGPARRRAGGTRHHRPPAPRVIDSGRTPGLRPPARGLPAPAPGLGSVV